MTAPPLREAFDAYKTETLSAVLEPGRRIRDTQN